MISVAICIAAEMGRICYTKHKHTDLLSQPDHDSGAVAAVSWGTRMKVIQEQGRWLKVNAGDNEGWIFMGNVSFDPPIEDNKSDFLPTASDTGAAVAARPLDDTAKEYASRHDDGNAVNDIQWMEREAAQVKRADLDTYQRANHVGEYAP
jgi:hypothetical protein